MTQEEKDKQILESQEFHRSQASKTSSLSRSIVFSIIATIWVVSFKKGTLVCPNWALIVTLSFSFFYLLVEIIHYFSDACVYYNESHNLFNDEVAEKKHDRIMLNASRRSFYFFVLNFILFVIICIFFIVGLAMQLSIT